mmetsp:Transcript_83238/g.182897  ORF Transcript_83238/g.182897 Transcript_83238/m.182897 type:complete len:160 (-) Transcript_83238:213-692(-)
MAAGAHAVAFRLEGPEKPRGPLPPSDVATATAAAATVAGKASRGSGTTTSTDAEALAPPKTIPRGACSLETHHKIGQGEGQGQSKAAAKGLLTSSLSIDDIDFDNDDDDGDGTKTSRCWREEQSGENSVSALWKLAARAHYRIYDVNQHEVVRAMHEGY